MSCRGCQRQVGMRRLLEALSLEARRATYAAVRDYMHKQYGGSWAKTKPFGFMTFHDRDQLHSWVVAAADGRPSGYETAECDPRLAGSPEPITDFTELVALVRRQ